MSFKQNKYEIKKYTIEKGYEERMRKIDNAQKIGENNVIEVKKLCNVLNDFENKNNGIYNKFEENSAKMCNEIKK